VESEPNEREWELAQAALNQYVGADKPGSFGVDDKFLGIIRGLLASYRAELTAPAGGDVETADKLVRRFYKIPDGEELADWAYKLRNEITAALYIAQQVERSKVPPPDEIHRDGYNEGVEAERERWKAAAREAYDYGYRIGQDEGYSTDPDYISPIRKEIPDALAALLAGEEAKSGK